MDGHTVRVYGVAKALADLFKYRNKVGLHMALEALREAWHERRFDSPKGPAHASVNHGFYLYGAPRREP
ncbi:MAG: hypothetical protein IMX02_13785 [Limnochordaceae bacterium]|nr:hypothetical protein [Limnochordaceae bacterium]